MALITLTSAHGAPGTTTTALGLAMAWPRPVLLVEADPAGTSSIGAGWLQGAEPPQPDTLVDLVLAARNTLVGELARKSMPLPGCPAEMRFVRGSVSPSQASSLLSLWEPLATALRALERNNQDVLVDCGRFGSVGYPTPLIHAADLCLVVSRATLPDVVALGAWVGAQGTISAEFDALGRLDHLGLLMIGCGGTFSVGQAMSRAQVSRVIGRPVLAELPSDAKAAAMVSHGVPGKLAKTGLGKALAAESAALAQRCRLVAAANEPNLERQPS